MKKYIFLRKTIQPQVYNLLNFLLFNKNIILIALKSFVYRDESKSATVVQRIIMHYLDGERGAKKLCKLGYRCVA